MTFQVSGNVEVKVINSSGSLNAVLSGLFIDPAVPTVSWSNIGAITYGTPLSAVQLDATANVPGTFNYSPAVGTILGAGVDALSVTFTPTDTSDYTTATGTTAITVNKAIPSVSVIGGGTLRRITYSCDSDGGWREHGADT